MKQVLKNEIQKLFAAEFPKKYDEPECQRIGEPSYGGRLGKEESEFPRPLKVLHQFKERNDTKKNDSLRERLIKQHRVTEKCAAPEIRYKTPPSRS